MKKLSPSLLFILYFTGLLSAQQPSCIVHVWPTEWVTGGAVLTAQDSSGTGVPTNYLWSNGSTSPSVNVPNQGTYCCTITYSDGCTAANCFTFELCDASAYWVGFDNQSDKLLLTAFRSPYYLPGTYLWSTGANTENIVVDSPGIYCVTITYANGCMATSCTEAGSTPCKLTIDYLLDTIAVPRSVVLQAQLTALGQKSYEWSTGDTTASLTLTSGGRYYLRATNDLSCFKSAELDFGCYASIQILDKQLIATAQSHFPPYSFLWNDGTTLSSISPKHTGFYSVTVTDAFGVSDSAFQFYYYDCRAYTQYQPDNTLAASSSGLSPFTYHWEPGGFHSASILPDTTGYYQVTITDANGCIGESGIYWYSPDSCLLECEVVDSFKLAGFVKIATHLPGYSWDWYYQWDDGSTGSDRYVDQSGTYCVTIVNNFNGCQTTKCMSVFIDSLVPDPPAKIVVRPNPLRDHLQIFLPEAAEIWLADGNGQIVHQKRSDPPITDIEMRHLSPGFYFVTVQTAKQTQTLKILKE